MTIIKLPLSPRAEQHWNLILEVIMRKELNLDDVIEDMVCIYADEHLTQWDPEYKGHD